MAQGPVFLERRSYRLRRMLDAVRLLPLLGFLLWMLPLIWPVGGQDVMTEASDKGLSTSTALLYIFGVWIGLMALSWLLWRRTRDALPQEGTPSD